MEALQNAMKQYESKFFLRDTIQVGHYMETPVITWKRNIRPRKRGKLIKNDKNLEGRDYKFQ